MKRNAALLAGCCLAFVLGASAQEQKPAQVAGTWELTKYYERLEHKTEHYLLTLEQDGANLTATLAPTDGQPAGKKPVRLRGEVKEGNKISLWSKGIRFEGTIEGDSMQGSWKHGFADNFTDSWKATRQSASGAAVTPEQKPAEEKPAQEQKPAQVAGKWDLTKYHERREPKHYLLTLEQVGGKLTGTLTGKDGESTAQPRSLGGTVKEGNKIKLDGGEGLWLEGTIEGDSMQGTWTDRRGGAAGGVQRGSWKATRQPASGLSATPEKEPGQERPAPEKPAEENPAQVAGKWDLTQHWEGYKGLEPTHAILTIEQDGTNVKGTFTYTDGRHAGETDSLEGEVKEGSKISLRRRPGSMRYEGTVERDSMQGWWENLGTAGAHRRSSWKAMRRTATSSAALEQKPAQEEPATVANPASPAATGSSQAPGQPAAPERKLASATPSASTPADRFTAAANRLVGLINASDYRGMVRNFNPQMREAFPAEKLKSFFEGLAAQRGKIQKIDPLRFSSPHQAVFLVHFERGTLDMKLALDAQDRIAGLEFVPPSQ